MGKGQSKHYDLASSYWPKEGVASLQLLLDICELAEEKAARLPRFTDRLMDSSQELRETAKMWQERSQKDMERLQGGAQVLKVASALSLLHTKLTWCHERVRRINKQPALLHSTQQRQCTKLLQILALAQEAQLNFTTAFQVAVQEGQREHKEHRHGSHSKAHKAAAAAAAAAVGAARAGAGEGVTLAYGSQAGSAWTSSGGAGDDRFMPAADGKQEADSMAVEQGIRAFYPEGSSGSDDSSGRQSGPRGPEAREASSAGGHASSSGGAAWVLAQAESADASADPAAAEAPTAAEWDGTVEDCNRLLLLAWHGDVGAILACAPLLRDGRALGMADCRTARSLLQLAADANVAEACLALGHMAEAGEGLLVADHEEAASWYGRAAQLGSAEGAYCLAFALEHGIGLRQDTDKAAEWYATAADAGHVSATNNLGHLLYQLSRSSSDVSSSRTAGTSAWQSSSTSSMPGSLNSAAAADAAQFFYQAAQQGSISALFNLGVCYAEGLACSASSASSGNSSSSSSSNNTLLSQADQAAAAECFARAAVMGHVGAHVRLGQLHAAQGRTSAARSHFTAAADAGDTTAMLELARIAARQVTAAQEACHVGTGTHAAAVLAQEAAQGLYLRAAETGEPEAQHWVANWLWDSGDGEGAVALWAQAAAQGHADALLALGAAAEQGDESRGLGRDVDTAMACYKLAASLGCGEAAAAIERAERDAAAALLQGSLGRLAGVLGTANSMVVF